MYFVESITIWGIVVFIDYVNADYNQTKIAVSGKEFVLNCSNTTDSTHSKWLFKGFNKTEAIIPDDDDRLSQYSNKSTLKLLSVGMTDVGMYKCSSFQQVEVEGKFYPAEVNRVRSDLIVLEKQPTCIWKPLPSSITCTIKYGGTKYWPRMLWRNCSDGKSFYKPPSSDNSINNIHSFEFTINWDLLSVVCLNIHFNAIPQADFNYTWNSSGIIRPTAKTTARTSATTITKEVVTTQMQKSKDPNSSSSSDGDDEDSLIIILVVAVGGFLCLLIFSFLGVFIARRSKFAVCENFNRKIEPDIMRHRDLPEALSIANYSMREMPEMEQQPPENELYINQEEMRHDSQPEINISRASSHQSVPEYQNSIDEMLNQVKTCKKVGSDGTVYIELNGPKLTPTLPIRPRRLPAPPPEVMAHSNSMYALVDHKPRIPPPPPNDI